MGGESHKRQREEEEEDDEEDEAFFAVLDAALLEALVAGNEDLAETLLVEGASSEFDPEGNGWTLLHRMSFIGSKSMASLLLRADADVDAITKEEGGQPLTLAAMRDFPEVALLLVEWGADPHYKDYAGRSAITHYGELCDPPMSEQAKELRVAELLMRAKRNDSIALDVELLEELNKPQPDLDVVADLIGRGVDPAGVPFVQQKDGDDWPWIIHCIMFGHLNVVQLLVERGAPFDFRVARTGQTPLFIACKIANVPIAKYLVSIGSDPLRPVSFIDLKTPISVFGDLKREFITAGQVLDGVQIILAERVKWNVMLALQQQQQQKEVGQLPPPPPPEQQQQQQHPAPMSLPPPSQQQQHSTL